MKGSSLYNWLCKSGYSGTSDKFKYGEELKEKLDELANKYKTKIRFTPEKYVELIEDYCRRHEEWPAQNATKEIERVKGSSLYTWLYSSGYSGTRDKFKYGEKLKDELDELKEMYYNKKYNDAKSEFDSDSNFNRVVDKIKSKENKNGKQIH